MLVLLLLHISITLASLFTGFIFYLYIIRDDNYEKANNYRPAIFYLISGLIALTLITQIFILFLPADFIYKISITGLLLLIAATTRQKTILFFRFIISEIKAISIPVKITLAATWCMVLVLNAGPTIMDDTDSYHIQMVKWIQEYGSVPGIANLHRRFGFNSSWFSSIALFGFEWKGYNFFTALNGVLSFWFASYLIITIGKNITRKENAPSLSSIFILIFITALISWPILRGNASSCNYDFITMLVIFVLFAETIKVSVQTNQFSFNTEWIVWPLFLFTVRIINFPFLLLSIFAFLLILQKKQWKKISVYFLLGLLVIIPFLARNIIVSGYLFYPALSFDWFPVDWKADKEKTILLLKYIKYYNRVSDGILDLDYTATLGFPHWISAWFKYMLTYNKMIFIPGIAGLILSPFLLFRKIEYRSKTILLFYIVIMIQLTTWFITAPDPRFVYGCLFAGILLLLLLLKYIFDEIKLKKIFSFLLLTMALSIMLFTIIKPIRSETYRNWIFPKMLPSPPVTTISIDGIKMHIPDAILNNWNPRCYATSLPCLYEVDPRLQARGKSIANGFKLKNR